jgi:hypothetical protein
MEDSKQDRADAQKTTDELLQERQSDATSDETIKEVEESRTSADASDNNADGAISPDGAFDQSKETGPI